MFLAGFAALQASRSVATAWGKSFASGLAGPRQLFNIGHGAASFLRRTGVLHVLQLQALNVRQVQSKMGMATEAERERGAGTPVSESTLVLRLLRPLLTIVKSHERFLFYRVTIWELSRLFYLKYRRRC